ncbi:MAG: hypothetical protein ACFE9L_09735 [Candidatus Hodarchaeota archaeon]
MKLESIDGSFKVLLNSQIVDKTTKKTTVRFPAEGTSSSSDIKPIILTPQFIGEWNPFEAPEKCIICWKPLEIHGKDAKSYMECRHCNRKAHQSHMLRWLVKKDSCPYCHGKW